MMNIITLPKDMSYLLKNFISNEGIAAKADAVIVLTDLIKKREQLRKKSNDNIEY